MKVISIWNNKGGVGKTSLSFHIAQGLALMGKTTLLIDNDPQMTLSGTYCGIESHRHGMSQIYKGEADPLECIYEQENIQIDDESTLAVIPGHSSFQDIFDPEKRDKFHLENLGLIVKDTALQETFDYAIIDNNPMFFGPSKVSIEMSDEVFIPCIPTKVDVQGLDRTIQNLRSMNMEHKIKKIIPVMVKNTIVSKINLKFMKRKYESLVSRTMLNESAVVPQMAQYNKVVYLSKATHKYATNMLLLIGELFPENRLEEIREKIDLVRKEQKIKRLMDWMASRKVSPLEAIQEKQHIEEVNLKNVEG